MAEIYTPTGATAAAIERFTSAEAATGTFGTMHRTFATEIADRTRFLATTGLIAFPATQVASADANTLDDYEEGAFTLDLTFGGGNTGLSFNTRSGAYTKIGRQVTCVLRFTLAAKGSSTGAAVITGLPFTAGAAASASVGFYDAFTGAGMMLGLLTTTSIALRFAAATTCTTLADTHFTNTSEMFLTVSYYV